jgi:hypothetical protein
MSKIAEKKALEIYPDIEINWTMTDRTKERMIYADGYDQAMQDFLEKACDYLKRNYPSIFDTYQESGYNEIEKFKEYLEL